MNANACTDSSVQAAIATEFVAPNSDNLPKIFFQTLQSNINPCNTHNLCEQLFQYNNVTFQSVIHLNISSLQAHFDELNEFLLNFLIPLFIMYIS